MKYTDPDGRVIKIDENEDQAFVQDVNIALDYLKKSEIGYQLIRELENSSNVFTIKKCDWLNTFDMDRFESDSNTIFWSARHTAIAENGEYNSPAICLMHEFAHAWEAQTENGHINFENFCKKNVDKLENLTLRGKREEFATMIERAVAKQLDEPAGRRRYNDLQRDQGYAYTVSLPEHSPLIHSRSWSK